MRCSLIQTLEIFKNTHPLPNDRKGGWRGLYSETPSDTNPGTAQYPNTLPHTPRHKAFLSKNKTTACWMEAQSLLGLQCHSLRSGQHSIEGSFPSENKVWSLQLIQVEPSWLWESQFKLDFPLFFQPLDWSRSIPWWSSLRGQNNIFGRTKTVFQSPWSKETQHSWTIGTQVMAAKGMRGLGGEEQDP